MGSEVVDFYDRLTSGYYSMRNYRYSGPPQPLMPESIRKTLAQATEEDIEALKKYKREKQEYDAAYKSWADEMRKLEAKLDAEFLRDLYSHHGLNPNNPFVKGMMAIAYDRGHSSGVEEVAYEFSSLVGLYKIAISLGMNEAV